jgi:hypothetical protein
MDFIKDLFGNLNPDAIIEGLVPDLSTVLGWIELMLRLSVMAGPLVLLGLGLWYFLSPPAEANHRAGYRFYFGMGSVEAWHYTQRIAGITWSVLGLVLSIIMAIVTTAFPGMDALIMATTAVTCLLWELGIVVASCLVINVIVLIRYDRFGNPRSMKR